MDIEKLIEEQKKTRQAIELLKNSKTYDELLKKIPEVELDWREKAMLDVDLWSYEESSRTYDMQAARYIKQAVDSFGKAKLCLAAVKKHYEGRIKEWEGYRDYIKAQNIDHKNDWHKMFENPDCLKFFEDYEKANNITESVYQEAMKIKGYNKYHRDYSRKNYSCKKRKEN